MIACLQGNLIFNPVKPIRLAASSAADRQYAEQDHLNHLRLQVRSVHGMAVHLLLQRYKVRIEYTSDGKARLDSRRNIAE